MNHKLTTTLVIVVSSLLAAGALALSGVALLVRFHETNAFKLRQDKVWHVVICDIEKGVLADKKTPTAEKVSFLKFYDGLLVHDVKTTPCNLLPRR